MLRLLNIRGTEKPDKQAASGGAAESDAQLVLLALQGDKRAFVEIVARHQAMVCGIAMGILGDFAASEDAAQEAFLSAWRKIHTLREPNRLRAWLGQIARTSALGHLRRRPDHDDLERISSFADPSPLPDETAANEEEAALVAQFLAGLPENYRMPLVLFYREGQSVRAVAETLNLSEEAVKQRLVRGREMLRDQMSGVVEKVLKRTGPTAVFTMTIAAAIGALSAPAAVAGVAFSATVAGTATGSGTATASSSAVSQLLNAMNTSNTFLAATALVAVVCVPIGYGLANTSARMNLPEPSPALQTMAGKTNLPAGPDFEHSALLAEWRHLHDIYGRTADSMPALHKAISELPDRFRRQAFGAALVAEWVQIDPTNGLHFFLAKGRDNNQRRQFFEEWLKLDATAVVNAVLASDGDWAEPVRECLKEIAQRAPDRLVEVVDRLPKPETYWDTNVRDAFAMLAEAQFSSARLAAESVTGPNRDQALSGVAKVWAKGDIDAALTWAKSLPNGTDKDEVIRAALVGKAEVDPTIALNLVDLVPAGGKYAYFATSTGARVLDEAAKNDFDSTVAWVSAHPGKLSREDLLGLAREVTQRLNADAPGFLSTQVAKGSLEALTPAINSALLNQASGQRAAVWDWLKDQAQTDATKGLKREVLQSSGFQDPELAMRLVTELPKTPEGDADVKELARCLLNGGNALYRYDKLMDQAPERLRAALTEAAFSNLRTDDKIDMQPWIARLSQLPEASRAAATESVARSYASQAPEEALAWATALPAGEAKSGAEAAVLSTWAKKDPQEAYDSLWRLPGGSGIEWDRCAESLVEATAEQFPREAWDLAMNIKDPVQQLKAATQAAKMLAARDATLANQCIESSPLPAAAKETLQKSIH